MIPKYHKATREFSLPCFDAEGVRFFSTAEIEGRSVGPLLWNLQVQNKRSATWECRNRWGVWCLRFRQAPLGQTPALEVRMDCRLVEKAKQVRLMPVRFREFSADHVLVHGRKMGGCESFLPGPKVAAHLQSEYVMAVTCGGRTLQLAHPLKQADVSSLGCRLAGRRVQDLSALTVFAPCDRKILRADPVTLAVSSDGHALMEAWAELQVRDRPVREDGQESGWNSWDYYRWTINEEEVLKNAEFIAADPVLSKHVKRIVVDDGWQYCYGEWEPNPLFPSGMESLAKKLTRLGFTPGLWFAPTVAEPHSRVAQLHPQMLSDGPAGVPCLAFSCMERKGFLLDPTHPDTRAWWRKIFRRYAGYGFRYYKLDFLASTFAGRRFADGKTRPAELMDRIIRPIRDAVGPKSRILGCNYTFDGGNELVDDVRVVSDIHASWQYVKRNAVAIAARFWAHRRFWINDPDFAVCRGSETSRDPHLNSLKLLLPYVLPERTNRELVPGLDAMDALADLTVDEARTWLSLVLISGGIVNLSDNLTRLNAVGLDLVRRTVAARRGHAGIALDLFQSELPSRWIQKISTRRFRILLANWEDRPVGFEVDLEAWKIPCGTVRDFWTDRPVVVRGNRITGELPAHGCLLAECF